MIEMKRRGDHIKEVKCTLSELREECTSPPDPSYSLPCLLSSPHPLLFFLFFLFFFVQVLTEMGAGKYDHKELAQEIDLFTSGIEVGPTAATSPYGMVRDEKKI
jgi:hypothetical protein